MDNDSKEKEISFSISEETLCYVFMYLSMTEKFLFRRVNRLFYKSFNNPLSHLYVIEPIDKVGYSANHHERLFALCLSIAGERCIKISVNRNRSRQNANMENLSCVETFCPLVRSFGIVHTTQITFDKFSKFYQYIGGSSDLEFSQFSNSDFLMIDVLRKWKNLEIVNDLLNVNEFDDLFFLRDYLTELFIQTSDTKRIPVDLNRRRRQNVPIEIEKYTLTEKEKEIFEKTCVFSKLKKIIIILENSGKADFFAKYLKNCKFPSLEYLKVIKQSKEYANVQTTHDRMDKIIAVLLGEIDFPEVTRLCINDSQPNYRNPRRISTLHYDFFNKCFNEKRFPKLNKVNTNTEGLVKYLSVSTNLSKKIIQITFKNDATNEILPVGNRNRNANRTEIPDAMNFILFENLVKLKLEYQKQYENGSLSRVQNENKLKMLQNLEELYIRVDDTKNIQNFKSLRKLVIANHRRRRTSRNLKKVEDAPPMTNFSFKEGFENLKELSIVGFNCIGDFAVTCPNVEIFNLVNLFHEYEKSTETTKKYVFDISLPKVKNILVQTVEFGEGFVITFKIKTPVLEKLQLVNFDCQIVTIEAKELNELFIKDSITNHLKISKNKLKELFIVDRKYYSNFVNEEDIMSLIEYEGSDELKRIVIKEAYKTFPRKCLTKIRIKNFGKLKSICGPVCMGFVLDFAKNNKLACQKIKKIELDDVIHLPKNVDTIRKLFENIEFLSSGKYYDRREIKVFRGSYGGRSRGKGGRQNRYNRNYY